MSVLSLSLPVLSAPNASADLVGWMYRPAVLPRHADSMCDGWWDTAKSVARAPFDTMRAQYASAVRAGLLENSMLASRDFERTVNAMERAALGPLARRV